VIAAFVKAVGQLSEPDLRRVVLRALFGAAAIFVLMCAGGWLLVAQIQLSEIAALNVAIDLLGGLAILVVAILLYPAAVTAIIGFFLEDVAEAVERRHYPRLPQARNQTLGEAIFASLRFALIALALNVLALPLYLVLLFVPPLNIFVFYGVNGYLVGREYFELAAFRRLPPEEARGLRQANRLRIFVAGVLTAFLLTVPFVNLVAPILGTAAMVHIFEALRRPARAGSSP